MASRARRHDVSPDALARVAGQACAALVGALLFAASAQAQTSTCHGTPSNGRLDGGVPIARSGANFQPYSELGVSLGRTHVHARVGKVVAAAYASLATSLPATTFVYGESGWPGGGSFKPHRTHQNGLAVDFMVPVLDANGRSVPLPGSMMNRFGYDIEFDRRGRAGELAIDFEAIAEHLQAIHVAARAEGIGVARVILDPAYLPKLHATRRGAFIRDHIPFMRGQAWVRHDEHYHIDFAVACKPL